MCGQSRWSLEFIVDNFTQKETYLSEILFEDLGVPWSLTK